VSRPVVLSLTQASTIDLTQAPLAGFDGALHLSDRAQRDPRLRSPFPTEDLAREINLP